MSSKTIGGIWKLCAVEAFDDACRDPTFDDSRWSGQEIPGHWQDVPGFESHTGKVVYRKMFDFSSMPDEQYWLRFNGVFYRARVFLNGAFIGENEGYFFPFEFNVTDRLKPRNLLVVEVESPEEKDKTRKRTLTGVFSHWDCMDPCFNPGGIWLPVEIVSTGPARISRHSLLTLALSEGDAELRLAARLLSVKEQEALLRLTLTPKNFAGESFYVEVPVSLRTGASDVEHRFSVSDPVLWWSHDKGRPNLYKAELRLAGCDGIEMDKVLFDFGIRTIEVKDFIFRLNGRRLFVKGSNLPPQDQRIARVSRQLALADMFLMRRANCNMARVHAHVGHPELYKAADEAGMLLWQEFPMIWLYDRSVLPQAERQIGEMFFLLGSHPSVAMWCIHNEPQYLVETRDQRLLPNLRLLCTNLLWNWNKDVLDVKLKRRLDALDPSRFVNRCSGEAGVVRKGTDLHAYFGWYPRMGPLGRFDAWAAIFPSTLRCLGEFGAQSFPDRETCAKFMDTDLAKADWDRIEKRHMLQLGLMRHWHAEEAFRDLDALAKATQKYQAKVNRFYVDRLRLRKYRPAGCAIQFMFLDACPGITWSVVDYFRNRKASYDGLKDSFFDVYVFPMLEEAPHPRDFSAPLYAVNDSWQKIEKLAYRWSIAAGGSEIASGSGDVSLGEDSEAVEAGRVMHIFERGGSYALVIEAGALRNEYELKIK